MNETIEIKERSRKAISCPKCGKGIMRPIENSPTERDADTKYQCEGCGYSNDSGFLWRYSN